MIVIFAVTLNSNYDYKYVIEQSRSVSINFEKVFKTKNCLSVIQMFIIMKTKYNTNKIFNC